MDPGIGARHLKAADDHGVGFRGRVSLTGDRLIGR
jgi:hypothetical protein